MTGVCVEYPKLARDTRLSEPSRDEELVLRGKINWCVKVPSRWARVFVGYLCPGTICRVVTSKHFKRYEQIFNLVLLQTSVRCSSIIHITYTYDWQRKPIEVTCDCENVRNHQPLYLWYKFSGPGIKILAIIGQMPVNSTICQKTLRAQVHDWSINNRQSKYWHDFLCHSDLLKCDCFYHACSWHSGPVMYQCTLSQWPPKVWVFLPCMFLT